MHNEVDRSKLVKHAVNSMTKTVNSSMDKNLLLKKASKLARNQENTNSTHLRLSGHEEECVFSSVAPEAIPTINVS